MNTPARLTTYPLLIALACSAVALTRAGETTKDAPTMIGTAGYGFLVAEAVNNVVAKYSSQGERVWEYPLTHPIDAWPLENGNVLATFLPEDRVRGSGGVREITPDKKVVFEYRAPGEVMSCQPLAAGRMMIAETTQGRIVEVERSGKVVHAFDLRTKGMGHKTCRLVRITPRDTYLVAETYVNLVREYDRQGNVLRQIKAPGCFGAEELADRHVLISQYYNPRVFEVDGEDRVVWELVPGDLPADFQIEHFGEARRLPSGNTLVVNYVRDAVPGRVTAFEITPQKKIVWQFRDSLHTRGITAIKPILNN